MVGGGDMEMLLFLVFLLICSFVVEFCQTFFWLVWVLWWCNLRGWDGEEAVFLRVYVGSRW